MKAFIILYKGKVGEYVMKKNILIVGGGPELTIFLDSIEKSKEWNFYSVSEIPPMYSDIMIKSIIVDFSQWEYTINEIRNLGVSFEAVACLDEVMTHIADDIAKELHIAPLSSLNSQPFRFKDRMRMVCEASGMRVPNYRIINSYQDSFKLSTSTYPLIVKPTSFLSSIGVKKVNNFNELQNQVEQQLNVKFPLHLGKKVYELGEIYNLENRVLVEEYIEGTEFSLESLIVNDKYIPLGITKKINNESSFMDEIGHIFPANINSGLKEHIYKWGENLHKVLHLQNTSTHAEFRVTESGEIVLMEIGARIGGDYISKLIFHSSNEQFDFFNAYINARIGIETEPPKNINGFTGICFIQVPSHLYGKPFNGVNFALEKISSRVLEKKITRSTGELLPQPINWSNERVGHVILNNHDYTDLEKDLGHIIQNSLVY